MNEKSGLNYILPGLLLYLAIPFLYLSLGDFPDRTFLKDAISYLTIGAFFLMLGQFYLSRLNRITLSGQKMSKVINIHKILGYIFIPILFLHPFLIVVPRFFESGVDPLEAFTTILSTFGTKGIITGITAMILMILLGVTSLLRKSLKMKYTTWRTFHGILSVAFIVLATWHAIDLGRHTDSILSSYMVLMAALGILVIAKVYIFGTHPEGAKQ